MLQLNFIVKPLLPSLQVESCHARMDNITLMEVAYIKRSLITASREIEALNKSFHELSSQNSSDQRYVVA